MFAKPFARLKFFAACVVALAFAVGLGAAPLRAASNDVDSLSDRLDRLERDIRDLQLEVYKGGPPPEGRSSDDRPAPGPATGLGAGGAARVADLEQSLRDLRGQVEQLSFLVKQMQSQAELQRNETNYRLGALEGGAPAGAIPPTASGPAPTSGPPAMAATTPRPTGAPGGPTQLAPGPGSQSAGAKPGALGSLPASAAPAAGAPADPKGQYDAAMELLSRQQIPEAQTAFRNFVQANPTSELAGPAQYWVGDISFTQKDYSGAAKAFADVLKRFPKTTKAPDAMLKLGLSLMELGQKNEGCTTLGAIKAKYPGANAGILSRAAQRFKESKCA